FQRTTDPDAKPLPVTMSVSAGLPATAVVGARLVITGTGEGCSGRSMPVLSNVAVTAALAFIVQEHVPVPLQAPLQPMNVEPDAAVAVSVIEVPMGTAALQVAPQEIPAGLLETVPAPVPVVDTESAAVGTATPAPLSTRVVVSPLATKF